jgi:hypothetical protein
MQTSVGALPGSVDTSVRYDLQGVAQKVYMPKHGQSHFYAQVGGKTVFFHESYYGKFEALDTIGVQLESGIPRRGGIASVGQGDTVVLLARYEPRVEVHTASLGYVSNPKEIGGMYWYLAVTEGGAYRIPYSVAKRYWLGDEDVGGDVPNYYSLLGVRKEATTGEIQAAWKEAIQREHPDRFPPELRDAQTALAARTNVARDTLTDPEGRSRYDAQLALEARQPSSASEEVRAWPGRGFGTLKARVEVWGDSFKVVEILSWANEELHFQGCIALRRLRAWDTGLVVEVSSGSGMYQQTEVCVIPWLMVGMSSLPSRWGEMEGVLEYEIDAIRTGRWDWENGRVVPGIRVRDCELKWPRGFAG